MRYCFIILLCTVSILELHVLAADLVAQHCPPVIQGNAACVAVDSAGNRYVAGSFSGTRDFNASIGSDERTAVGGTDAFITRYNRDGSYAWTVTFGGSLDDAAARISVSGSAVCATGSFSSSNAGFGGAGTVSSAGGVDCFVIVLDAASGAQKNSFGFAGVQTFGGSGDDFGNGVVATAGAVYVTGNFLSSDAKVGGAGATAAASGSDCFVLALDVGTGARVSGFGTEGVQKFGGTGDDIGYDITADGPKVYVIGSFNSTNAGIGGSGTLATTGMLDCFIVAMSATTGLGVSGFGTGGAQKFGGTKDDAGQGILANSTYVYITGWFASSFASVNGTDSASTTGNADCFYIKLNVTDGRPVNGIQQFGGSGNDYGRDIVIDSKFVFIAGSFESANAGFEGSGSTASAGGSDAFVIAYDRNFDYKESSFGIGGCRKFGGTGNDYGYGIAFDGVKLFAAGNFESTDASAGTPAVFSAANFGGFLLPLSTDYYGFNLGKALVVPEISSALVAYGAAGAYSYQITATNLPSSFDALTLPPGLTINTQTGLISGDLSLGGPYDVTLRATNGAGTGEATMRLWVRGTDLIAHTYPPVIQGSCAGVAVDDDGNQYVAGTFSTTFDFNTGVGVDEHTNYGRADAFVTRFNANGTYAWTQTFGGTGDDLGSRVCVAGSRVYMTGRFSSQDAGINGLGTNAQSGNADVFVIALDTTNGDPISSFGNGGVQTFGGSLYDISMGIAASETAVYISGFFESKNAGFGGLGSISALATRTCFILAFDAATGQPMNSFGANGVQIFGGTTGSYGHGIAYYNSTVYVGGYFFDLNAGIGGPGTIASTGYSDAFLLALDSTTGLGKPSFGNGGVQRLVGSGDEKVNGVAVSAGSVYIVGDYSSKNLGIGVTRSATAAEFGTNAFIAALDAANGAPRAAFGNNGIQTFGGRFLDYGYAIAASGTIVSVAGSFESSNAGVGAEGSYDAVGYWDAYLLMLDSATGQPIPNLGNNGFRQFGGTNYDEGYGTAISTQGKIYSSGSFFSDDAGYGAVGPFDSKFFRGFLLTVEAFHVNQAPVAQNGSLQALGKAPAAGQLSATDEENDILYYELVAQPQHGVVALNIGNGEFTYTAAANVDETDSFTFRATDGDRYSNIATVSVTLSHVNEAPYVIGAVTAAPNPVLIGENVDFVCVAGDVENDPLTILWDFGDGNSAAGSNVSHSFATKGLHLVRVTINDGQNEIEDSVSVNVIQNQAAPIANNGSLTVVGTTPKTGLLSATDADGNPITFSIVTAPLKGALNLNASSGVFTYTSTANVSGADSFSFKANDGQFDSNVATVNVALVHANIAPQIVSAPYATPAQTFVGVPVSFSVSAADPDGDLLEITWTFQDGATAAGATVTHAFAGAGNHTVIVTVSDGILSVQASIVVNVVAPGQASATKGAVKFIFTAQNKDSFTLSGTIGLPNGFVIRGKTLDLHVADFEASGLVFDSRNSAAREKTISFKLTAKTDKSTGAVLSQPVKFALSIKSLTLFDALKSAGFVDDHVKSLEVPLTSTFVIDSKPYSAFKVFAYTAKKGKSGSGK